MPKTLIYQGITRRISEHVYRMMLLVIENKLVIDNEKLVSLYKSHMLH